MYVNPQKYIGTMRRIIFGSRDPTTHNSSFWLEVFSSQVQLQVNHFQKVYFFHFIKELQPNFCMTVVIFICMIYKINLEYDNILDIYLDVSFRNLTNPSQTTHHHKGQPCHYCIYRTRAIIACSWFETAHDYKPLFLVIQTALLYNINHCEIWGKKYTNRGL